VDKTLHLLRTHPHYIKPRLNPRPNSPPTETVKTNNKCNSKEESSRPLESALGNPIYFTPIAHFNLKTNYTEG